MKTFRAFIAMGANLGDKRAQLSRAARQIGALSGTRVVAQAKVRSTRPVGGPRGQQRYVNSVVEVETSLLPRKLMAALLKIERVLGRDRRTAVKNGPRVIDLDLLLYDNIIMKTPTLTLPHPRMHQRRFVIDPMCDLAPQLIHPVEMKTMLELRRELKRAARSGGPRLKKRNEMQHELKES